MAKQIEGILIVFDETKMSPKEAMHLLIKGLKEKTMNLICGTLRQYQIMYLIDEDLPNRTKIR